jgi:hypothetical protein
LHNAGNKLIHNVIKSMQRQSEEKSEDCWISLQTKYGGMKKDMQLSV